MKEIHLDSLSEEMIFLLEVVGMDSFLKICNQFQGDTIYFPRMKSYALTQRNLKIKEEYKAGRTINELSFKYSISTRQVKRVLLDEFADN